MLVVRVGYRLQSIHLWSKSLPWNTCPDYGLWSIQTRLWSCPNFILYYNSNRLSDFAFGQVKRTRVSTIQEQCSLLSTLAIIWGCLKSNLFANLSSPLFPCRHLKHFFKGPWLCLLQVITRTLRTTWYLWVMPQHITCLHCLLQLTRPRFVPHFLHSHMSAEFTA